MAFSIKDDTPPPPPTFQRRIAIAPVQAVGVGVLLLVVVVAMTGRLGQTPGQLRMERGPLQVQVTYPEIVRFKAAMPLEIRVTNAGSSPLESVSVRLDRDYVDDFQDVRFTPEASRVTDKHVELSLPALAAGETREVVTWLEAHERGRRKARLDVSAGDGAALDMRWSTLVLP